MYLTADKESLLRSPINPAVLYSYWEVSSAAPFNRLFAALYAVVA